MVRHADRLLVLGIVAGTAISGLCCVSDSAEETLTFSESVSGETVVRWNDHTMTLLGNQPPDLSARNVAMVHIAMHDAANNVEDHFKVYALQRGTVKKANQASPALAAAAAAHDVLVALLPAQQAAIDAMLQPDIAATPQNARAKSLEVGAAAANAILTDREDDGIDQVVSYTFKPAAPGVYQAVPPIPFAVGANIPFIRPFVITSASQFRPAQPPALTSATWTADYNEVLAYGRIDSTVRTADQTNAAEFWFEGGNFTWNRVARQVATADDKGLWTTARLFALLNVNVIDSAIAVFDSKYAYEFWRPYTAIRAGDTDGNPATAADPNWNPLSVTPPHPEYVAAHGGISAASSAPLTSIYGDVAVTVTSTTSSSPRSFDSFNDMVDEVIDARVWAGFHYRNSGVVGANMGFQLADFIFDRAFVCTNGDCDEDQDDDE